MWEFGSASAFEKFRLEPGDSFKKNEEGTRVHEIYFAVRVKEDRDLHTVTRGTRR